MYDNSKFLTPEQMIKLAETEEGKNILFAYFMSARVAMGIQQIFEMLNVSPEPGLQHRACETLYNTMFRVRFEHVMAYIDSVKEAMDGTPEDFVGRVIANC